MYLQIQIGIRQSGSGDLGGKSIFTHFHCWSFEQVVVPFLVITVLRSGALYVLCVECVHAQAVCTRSCWLHFGYTRAVAGLTITKLMYARSKPRHSSNTSLIPAGASPYFITSFSTTIRRSARRAAICRQGRAGQGRAQHF